MRNLCRLHYLTFPQQVEAVQMWNRGKDTYDIAQRFNVHQSVIANKLPHWRESFRTLAVNKEAVA